MVLEDPVADELHVLVPIEQLFPEDCVELLIVYCCFFVVSSDGVGGGVEARKEEAVEVGHAEEVALIDLR